MSNVIQQPCASPTATVNFENTVHQSVALARILPHLLPDDQEALQQIYPTGRFTVWGVVAGTNDRNVGRWKRIQRGDVALFIANKRIFATAVVTYKLKNSIVANKLWAADDAGQPYEYLYFLDEVQEANISIDVFKQVVGYEAGLTVRSFEVLHKNKSDRFFTAFDLQSETYIEPISQTTYEKWQDEQSESKLSAVGETDGESVRKYRKEQGYLKDALVGYRTIAPCGICQQTYPVGILVAAHIKPRAKCNTVERRDVNVAMLMCKFGCDELFERGYIAVDAGKVVDLEKKPTTAAVQKRLIELVGKSCVAKTPLQAGYFAWHLASHIKKNS